jgi:hypothetical protein
VRALIRNSTVSDRRQRLGAFSGLLVLVGGLLLAINPAVRSPASAAPVQAQDCPNQSYVRVVQAERRDRVRLHNEVNTIQPGRTMSFTTPEVVIQGFGYFATTGDVKPGTRITATFISGINDVIFTKTTNPARQQRDRPPRTRDRAVHQVPGPFAAAGVRHLDRRVLGPDTYRRVHGLHYHDHG